MYKQDKSNYYIYTHGSKVVISELVYKLETSKRQTRTKVEQTKYTGMIWFETKIDLGFLHKSQTAKSKWIDYV